MPANFLLQPIRWAVCPRQRRASNRMRKKTRRTFPVRWDRYFGHLIRICTACGICMNAAWPDLFCHKLGNSCRQSFSNFLLAQIRPVLDAIV